MRTRRPGLSPRGGGGFSSCLLNDEIVGRMEYWSMRDALVETCLSPERDDDILNRKIECTDVMDITEFDLQ